jgi:hypothetical protein
MGKFGRKVCCNFNANAICVLLVDGNKLCIFDESTQEQLENSELQFGFCPLLPASERANVLTALKKEGFMKMRSFRS